MKGTDLRNILESLELSQADFARLIDVTPRAVSLWLTEEREIAGPVTSYIRLLTASPRVVQAKEFARIKQEDPKMYEGMYSFTFQGREGSGLGVMVLEKGRVFGSDGGVQYDGTYEPSQKISGHVDVHLHLSVPSGVPLVQGVPPQQMGYAFDLDGTFAPRGITPLSVQTPFGPVQAQVRFLRSVPT